jgi:hypothetical protein
MMFFSMSKSTGLVVASPTTLLGNEYIFWIEQLSIGAGACQLVMAKRGSKSSKRSQERGTAQRWLLK